MSERDQGSPVQATGGVYRFPPGSEAERIDRWRPYVTERDPEVCIRLSYSMRDDGDLRHGMILLAGTATDVLANLEGIQKGEDHVSHNAEVLYFRGFDVRGPTVGLFRNALTSVLLGREGKGDVILAAVQRKLEAIPAARRIQRSAEAVIAGKDIRPAAWAALDAGLRDPEIRQIAAEKGLDTSALAQRAIDLGVAGAFDMKAAWDRAMFGASALGGENPEHGELSDPEGLHHTLRWLTGEDPAPDRFPINHDSGGCAAFATILNRVLDGKGCYVLSGDPRLGLCLHVALRLGDRIVDGAGVHEPDAFYRQWTSGGGPVQFMDPSPGGDRIRKYAAAYHGLDEPAIEEDLREALGMAPDLQMSPGR